jgi:hypothetical protein
VGEPLPRTTGFVNIQANLPAVVQNTGLELTINTVNFRSNTFKWTTSVNLTVPDNKLIAFPGLSTSLYKNTYVVGKSLSISDVFHYSGVNPQTGLYSFATKNADGTPSYPQDLVWSRPITQKYYGGMQNSFSFKGLRLDIFIQYVNQLGHNYQFFQQFDPGYDGVNQPTAVLKRWTTTGDLAGIQRFGSGNEYYSYATLGQSDGVIKGASFLRLKNLALSYTMPDKWMGKSHVDNARIYLQCQNLFTVSHYLGLDPEIQGFVLPPLRMITAGLQVNL